MSQIMNLKQQFDNDVKFKMFIYSRIKPPTSPFTLSSIEKDFYEEFGLSINKREPKWFIKNDLQFSFKKGGSSTKNVVDHKNKLMKSIFSWDLLSAIMENTYLINVDEVSFNHKFTQSYSWLPKSQNTSIINILCKNNWSMITGFALDGEFLGVIIKRSVSAEDFIDFLSILVYAITHNK